MKINWMKEIVKPYNKRHGTAFKSGGELLSYLKYDLKMTNLAMEALLCVCIMSMTACLKKEGYFRPGACIRKSVIRDYLETKTRKEIAEITFKQIRKAIPDVKECSIYNYMSINGYKYKKRTKWN